MFLAMLTYNSESGSSIGFNAQTEEELKALTDHYVAYYAEVCNYNLPFSLEVSQPCASCNGEGKKAKRGSKFLSVKCKACNGSGKLAQPTVIDFTELPAIDESLLSQPHAPKTSRRYVSTPMLVQVLYPDAQGENFIARYNELTHDLDQDPLQKAWAIATIEQRTLLLRLLAVYAKDPTLTHTPGTHPVVAAQGIYKIVVGNRASFWQFAAGEEVGM